MRNLGSFRLKMSCRNAALTVITIFSRLYPEFSQQLNDFAPKTQGNSSKTLIPDDSDHSLINCKISPPLKKHPSNPPFPSLFADILKISQLFLITLFHLCTVYGSQLPGGRVTPFLAIISWSFDVIKKFNVGIRVNHIWRTFQGKNILASISCCFSNGPQIH